MQRALNTAQVQGLGAAAAHWPPCGARLSIVPFTSASLGLRACYSLSAQIQISEVSVSSCYCFTTGVSSGYWEITRHKGNEGLLHTWSPLRRHQFVLTLSLVNVLA